MTTRRIVLYGLAALLVVGILNFVWRSVQIRTELGRIASSSAATQEQGVRSLMARRALFDALQGGAPPKTRLNAIAALQRIAAKGSEPEAFSQLLQMQKDPDTESAEKKTHPVRDAATTAVAAVGAQYPERLLDAAKDQDKAIQDQSREALKKIGAPMMTQMAARLGDAKLRAPLGGILSGIGPQTVPLITPFLAADKLPPADKPDDLNKAKVELIEVLGKYKAGKDASAQDRAHVAAAARAVIPFKDDPNPNVRRTVITSLSNLEDPVGAPVLIEALNSQATDSDARQAAAGALGAIATPEATAAMIQAMSEYDLRIATAAAAGLRRAGEKAAGAVGGALSSPDPAIRARAAEAAGGMKTPALAVRALRDPDAGVRAAAAASLADIPGAASITPLIGALNDPDGRVASAAAVALARIGHPAVAPLVSRLAAAGDTEAYYASQALTTIGAPAVDPLLSAAQLPNGAGRWAAITLGEIGDPRAASVLETLARSTDPDTAWAAGVALTKVKQG